VRSARPVPGAGMLDDPEVAGDVGELGEEPSQGVDLVRDGGGAESEHDDPDERDGG
jgi:hypothetical protein